MAEIGTTTSNTTWAPASVIHPATDARQSPKQDQKKYNQQQNNSKRNPKKKPPDSGINSHIDEYA